MDRLNRKAGSLPLGNFDPHLMCVPWLDHSQASFLYPKLRDFQLPMRQSSMLSHSNRS